MLNSFSKSFKHSWKRVLACLLAVIAVIGLLPGSVMAADGDTGGLNPGSPGGQKPNNTNTELATTTITIPQPFVSARFSASTSPS